MTSRRRIVLSAAGVVALLYGAYVILERVEDARGHVVPAHGGRDSCRVWKNEAKEAVLAKCGEPCGTGFIPKAACPDEIAKEQPGPIALCSWECDLYGKVWVCYCGRVIDIGVGLKVVSSGPCSWRAAD